MGLVSCSSRGAHAIHAATLDGRNVFAYAYARRDFGLLFSANESSFFATTETCKISAAILLPISLHGLAKEIPQCSGIFVDQIVRPGLAAISALRGLVGMHGSQICRRPSMPA
jgi:hypothetical protein